MKLKIGFIGLGEMGKWMAINVARAGFPDVYDVRPVLFKSSEERSPAGRPL
jgi:3-hydroxyisobutyrate dehydrogenase-like beta-hydroxyacid dehydrogenase